MAQLPHEREFGDYGEWPGRDVLDSGGDRVGGVREIYLDRDTGRPEWVLVEVEDDAPRFVPLAGATVESGTIHLAHPASVVRAAPSIGPEPHIDNDQERELYTHYGLGYSEEASESGLPDGEPAEAEPPPLWSEAATEEWQAPGGEPEPDVAAPGVPGPALSEPPEEGGEAAPEAPGLPDLAVAGAVTADIVAPDPAAPPPGLPDLTPPDEPAPDNVGTADVVVPDDADVGTADLVPPSPLRAEPPPPGPPRAFPPPRAEPPPPEPPRAFPPPPDPGMLPVPSVKRRLGLAGGAAVLALLLFVVARKLRG